jgi:hypothetical protein
VTSYEAWDFKEQQIKQLVWRQYFVKVLNLTVVLLIRAEMVANTSWFRSEPLLQFNSGKTDDKEMYDCREDEFAIYFLKQVITDFVTKIVVDALIALVKKFISRIRKINN